VASKEETLLGRPILMARLLKAVAKHVLQQPMPEPLLVGDKYLTDGRVTAWPHISTVP
jgi:hypothetical protein